MALTAELSEGLAFSDLSAGHQQLEVLLDEPNVEFGVPRRAFAELKARAIHVSTTTQLLTGDAYGQQALPRMKRPPFAGPLGGRIFASVSEAGFKLGAEQEIVVMNHYGLRLADPEARRFLMRQMEEFFFGETP